MKSFLNYSKNRILYNLCRFIFVFLSIFLISKCDVKAEVLTGENYPEFATSRYKLLEFFTYSSIVPLYGYNGTAANYPQLKDFLDGSTSLVRYENNTDDSYGAWGIRVYDTYLAPNTYLMSWRVIFKADSVASAFCSKTGSPGAMIGATINSVDCSYSGSTAYLLVNYTLNQISDGTTYIDFNFYDGGMSINWFLRNANLVYYPQITVSPYLDTDGIEEQNKVIINQNQTIIDQNNQTNEKLDKAEETRKGIWDTIKELPNMFLDMLKSLFIPSDDFFETFINDFMSTLKEKLGFLIYPFELFADIINRFLDIPEGNGIIHIPQINDPFYNHELIPEQDFNIGEIFKTGKIGELHNIYLIFIDFYIIIKLINLALKKFNATFGGGVTE